MTLQASCCSLARMVLIPISLLHFLLNVVLLKYGWPVLRYVPMLKIEDLEAIPTSTLSVPNQVLQMYCGTQHSPYTDYGT